MGYKWTQSIATHDRVFKSKVITMVIQELPMALKLAPTQTLVIDYAGTPEEYRMVDGALRLGSAPRPTWPGPLGEADIKFTRYGEIYRDLLVDSVDGPGTAYPLRSSTRSWPSATSRGARCGVRTWQGPRCASASAASPRGRPVPQEKNQDGQGSIQASRPSVLHLRVRQHPAPAPVLLRLLYHALRDILLQCTGPLPSNHYICMLLGLISLAGTNYISNMPQVSGKTLFNLLPDLWVILMRVYRPETGQLNVDCMANLVIAAVHTSSTAHVKASPSLQHVLLASHASKLSDSTRDSLPVVQRFKCTVCNVHWLILYWCYPALVPDPLACSG